MKIAVIKETRPNETRVALTPDTVKKMVTDGYIIQVEQGAGTAAGYPDKMYQAAGAALFPDAGSAAHQASVLAVVQPPPEYVLNQLAEGAVLMGLLDPFGQAALCAEYNRKNLTSFAL